MHLGLGFKEARRPWSRYRYEYSAVRILEHFVKVYLPHTKKRKLPTEAPMENLCLPEFPTLETLTGDVDEYFSEQEKTDNQLRLKALGEGEN